MTGGGFEPVCERNEGADPFYRAVRERAFADAIPISGTFELTCRCNFDCRMCYVHLKPEEMPRYGRELSAKEWMKVAEDARAAGTVWLCVTGGEPLMHPEFETIWRGLTGMGFFITLQTNASLIDERAAKLLEECPPVGVKATLYGASDEVYEAVCRVRDGFSKTDRGLRTLRKLGIPVQLVSTVIRQNEADLPRMADYARDNGLPYLATGNVKPSVRTPDSQAREARVQEKLNEAKRREILHCLKGSPVKIERKPCTYCRDYRLGYWVTWNGFMRFCSFMNEPDIPVRGQVFSEAWKELLIYEETLDWPEECKTCRARSVCRKCAGTLAVECGGPRQVTDEFCGRIKQYYDEWKGDEDIWDKYT